MLNSGDLRLVQQVTQEIEEAEDENLMKGVGPSGEVKIRRLKEVYEKLIRSGRSPEEAKEIIETIDEKLESKQLLVSWVRKNCEFLKG